MATPICPTCKSPGRLIGLKFVADSVAFICSLEPAHWQIYQLDTIIERGEMQKLLLTVRKE